jgi:hypothetical protein
MKHETNAVCYLGHITAEADRVPITGSSSAAPRQQLAAVVYTTVVLLLCFESPAVVFCCVLRIFACFLDLSGQGVVDLHK